MLTLYILFINITAYIVYWKDKICAEKGLWRVPESTLICLALFGGAVGASLAMTFFRHKTQKPLFKIVLLLGYLQFFLYSFMFLASLF